MVADDAPLSIAAHHHALQDVDTLPGGAVPRARHAADLAARDLTSLTVDGAQAGVGGIDSWGSLPLAQHQLDPARPYSWAFTLRPFAPSDSEPAVLAARQRRKLSRAAATSRP